MRIHRSLFVLGLLALAAPLRAVVPSLQVIPGPLNPGAQTLGAGAQATFLQFTVSNTSLGEAVDISQFDFAATGTANDLGDDLSIYLDDNQMACPMAPRWPPRSLARMTVPRP